MADNSDLESLFFRPCTCKDAGKDEDKGMCYVEGSLDDTNASETLVDLSETVWFKMKPPRCFGPAIAAPYVSARRLQIARAQLKGKIGDKVECDERDKNQPPNKGVMIGMDKHKSAVRFLSKTRIKQTDDD